MLPDLSTQCRGRQRSTPNLNWLALATALVALWAVPARAQLGPPPQPPANPVTPAKDRLGKVLFWDEQLSSTRTVACGTCHFPETGGGDPRSGVDPLAVHPGPDQNFGGVDDILGSPGVPENDGTGVYDWSDFFGLNAQVTRRRTTSPLNAAYSPTLFWDGRASTQFVDPVTMAVIIPSGGALESQAVGPPTNDVEMGHIGRDWPNVLARLSASTPLALSSRVPPQLLAWVNGRTYGQLFQEAFGTPEITAPRFAMAVASHERTLFTNQTPFDQWIANGTGLTPQELAGRTVFAGAAQCDNCHLGEIMTDHLFHYIGVRPKTDDLGRMEVTGNPAHEGQMRTPTLRNVELRAPYMHNGRFATLDEVIEFYDRGGDFANTELPVLNLTAQQKADLKAFITRPLTDPRVAAGLPPFDRPRLYTETTKVPTVSGTGVAGSGGFVPMVVAVEPGLIGNPNFTVGVWNVLGGANALLVIDDVDPGLTTPGSGEFAFETTVMEGAGAGAGFGSISVPIANNPALAGREWFGRWYITDPGAPSSTAISRLFRFRTFLPPTVFINGVESGNTSGWSAVVP